MTLLTNHHNITYILIIITLLKNDEFCLQPGKLYTRNFQGDLSSVKMCAYKKISSLIYLEIEESLAIYTWTIPIKIPIMNDNYENSLAQIPDEKTVQSSLTEKFITEFITRIYNFTFNQYRQ